MESKREIRVVELKDTSEMSEAEKVVYAKKLWGNLTGKKVEEKPK